MDRPHGKTATMLQIVLNIVAILQPPSPCTSDTTVRLNGSRRGGSYYSDFYVILFQTMYLLKNYVCVGNNIMRKVE